MSETTGATASGSGQHQSSVEHSKILEALDIIYDPRSTNEQRWEASRYLDQFKESAEAAQLGFLFSTDVSQPPSVQHFGLSLLSHVIRHQYHHLSEHHTVQLRNCVLDLAKSIKADQRAYIRNKVAELWIELAKRSWALDWFDMDEQLVRLWSQDLVHQEFVLTVLENLSEDIFVRDDNIAVLRGRDLNSALLEIVTPSEIFVGRIKIGAHTHKMRFGEEGWLARIMHFVRESYVDPSSMSPQLKEVMIKTLATLRSTFTWVMTQAISYSSALQTTGRFLMSSDSDLVIAALDALLSLYGRIRLEESEVRDLVYPLIEQAGVTMLTDLYSWSIVRVDEIESGKYVVSKKLSELMSLVGDHMCQYAPPATDKLDLIPFLRLLTTVAEHESLIVSIPVIHAWVKLLEVSSWRAAPAVWECIGSLLLVAAERLIQYDQFPEALQNSIVTFVNEEIELFPERQGFYLNYRRLCAAVVEWICFAQPDEALGRILGMVDTTLNDVQSAERISNDTQYERVTQEFLQADARFTLLDAAFKGFDRIQERRRQTTTPEQEGKIREIREFLKSWLLNMMKTRNFQDPQITQRQIKTVVDASYRILQKDTGFAFNVLEHILASFVTIPRQDPLYMEAVDDLHNYGSAELRRLSLQHADYFVTFYEQLQAKFSDLIGQVSANERLQIDLKSILFSVIQRATSVDHAQRQAKLEEFLHPIAASWADPGLQESLGSFESFAHLQAFDRVGPYLTSLEAGRIEDWSQVQYDNIGMEIQKDMSAGYSRLPLRETRILLSISTERLEESSELHKMICDLWSPMVPTMLEYVLRLTSYNHRLHDPSSWPNVPPGLEGIIKRVLRDRYWQSGISAGSMGDFHSKVKATKSTLEGFASSVRGRIRNNLEQCYSILHTLGRLGPAFYSLEQLPQMIAATAIDTATPLSPHHFSVMLQMLPKLIEECPPAIREHFLTPVLWSLLVQIDNKLVDEWQKMGQLKLNKHEGEDLGNEMRDDSVLRQTTYKAVNLVAHWLNPKREQQLSTKKSVVNGNYLLDGTQQTMREFLLSNVQILEKLLIFTTHAIEFKDTKSSNTMLTAVQRLVPDFATERFVSGDQAGAVREFLSKDMLQTAITCLHDGYFADQQQYYAQLIATIWVSYGLPAHVPATESAPAHDRPSLTETPTNVILSLPGMTTAKVETAAGLLYKEAVEGGNRSKKLRAIILSLLEEVRGVRISELGKIDTKQQQSKILEKYKQREMLSMPGSDENGQHQQNPGPEVDLGGVADMFAG